MIVVIPFGILLTILLAVQIVRGRAARRNGIAMTVVANLAGITRQNLPLPIGLEMAAELETGKRALVLRRIARNVSQGRSLFQALQSSWPRCPGIVLTVIDVAERCHHLPGSLQHLETYLAEQAKRFRQFQTVTLTYPAVLLSFAGVIVAGIMMVVVPKYEEIFKDFATPLPAITTSLIAAADWLAGQGPLGDDSQDHIPGILLFILLFLVLVGILSARYFSRPSKPNVFVRLEDVVRWYTPGRHRCEQAAGLAHVADTIRLSLLAGLPLHEAFRHAGDLDINCVLRWRLKSCADDLERGTPAEQAVRTARLGGFLEWAFGGSAGGQTLVNSLAFIRDYYQSAAFHWMLIFRQATFPVMVILLGIAVGCIVTALFVPLVGLINGVMAQMVP